jgi:hypothetical protein
MPEVVNPVSIFVPVLVVVALTFLAFLRLAVGRAKAVKGGHDMAYYRAGFGDPEPEFTVVGVRHYGNLFEMPTVFYAGCLTAFALGAVGRWTLVFAWAYVAARLVQSAVHLTYNRPAHRGMAFFFGNLCLIGLWVTVALSIFARL